MYEHLELKMPVTLPHKVINGLFIELSQFPSNANACGTIAVSLGSWKTERTTQRKKVARKVYKDILER
jgi:hypothetical protein